MLRVERRGSTAVWTVARPEAKNALDEATMTALAAALADASGDSSLRAVVLTGEGDAFVSGGDLRELAGKHTRADAERFADAGASIVGAIGALGVPVIAAIPGVAFGGGAELAVACDLRVADPRARLSFKQVRLGVTTAWGTMGRLVALVGAGAAARLLCTAYEAPAEQALAMGLVDAVSDADGSLAMAVGWAEEIAHGSPDAVARMKGLVREASAPSAALLALERESFLTTWAAPDHIEAMDAYAERRSPRWRPRG